MDDNDKKLMVVDEPALPGVAGNFIPAVVVIGALVGFVALAWYAYHAGAQSTREDDLLVVEADKTPIKEKPTDPGGMQFPNQDKTIFETFSNNNQPAKVERVLPTPEEPLPPVASDTSDKTDTTTWVNDKLQSKKAEQVIGKKPEAEEKAPAPVVAANEPPTAAPKAEEAAPTMPTIHKTDDPAPASDKPTDKVWLDNKNPPKAEVAPLASVPPAPVEEKPVVADASAETYIAPPVVKAETKTEAKPETKVDAKADVKPAEVTPPAPVVAVKPAEEKPAAPVETKAVVAAPALAEEKPAVTAKVEAKTGSFKVQLGAYGSEKEAKGAWAKIQKKHPELAGLSPAIVEADLEKGIFYRLRATGIESLSDAKALCKTLSASGQACIIPTDK